MTLNIVVKRSGLMALGEQAGDEAGEGGEG